MSTNACEGLGPIGQGEVRPPGEGLASTLVLPPVDSSGGFSLMRALQQRRSQREFVEDALPVQMLGDLLWAACGVNRPASGGCTVPKAMQLQMIDVFVALPAGLYRYDAAHHVLRLRVPRDVRALTGHQDFTAVAAFDLVFVVDDSQVQLVQVAQREAYAHTTAGAMAQNVSLYCASKGFATVLRAWIDRDALKSAMALATDQYVLLAQTVGYPKSSAGV